MNLIGHSSRTRITEYLSFLGRDCFQEVVFHGDQAVISAGEGLTEHALREPLPGRSRATASTRESRSIMARAHRRSRQARSAALRRVALCMANRQLLGPDKIWTWGAGLRRRRHRGC
jgi:hypothetical protein